MTGAPLSCSRCAATINLDDLVGGLAVRVHGELVCQMCVETLPGEAVVRINQVRAMRGLEATTYAVKLDTAPRLQLYSFTTSANIAGHRRKLASDGFFEAPPLPPPSERQKAPPPEPAPKIVTDRVAKGQMPARAPMLIAAGGTLVVLGSIALAFALAMPEKKETASDAPAAMPAPAPAKALKTRIDFPADPLQAWTQAAQDRDCPTMVLQGIALELTRKRGLQLDDAEQALIERRIDDATAVANALTLPDDIAFRELRRRESDLRARLLSARTVASAPRPAAPAPTSLANPLPTLPTSPTPTPLAIVASATDGSLRLSAEAATITGTGLSLVKRGNIMALTNWQNPADTARWKVRIDTPGNYLVEVRTASESSGDCQFQVQASNQRVVAKLAATGGWINFTQTTLGVITLTAGEHDLSAGASDAKTWNSLSLAEIRLFRTTDPSSVAPSPAAPTPTMTPPPDKQIERAVVITRWKQEFVTGGRDKPPKAVELDGSEHLPAGLPGGVSHVFRSTKSQALKRHAAFLDLAHATATEGGVVVLLHPGRKDRKDIILSLTDAKGTTVRLDPIALPEDTWTPVVVPIASVRGLDPSALVTLALEDNLKASSLPDDGGFLIANTVTVSNRAPAASDLALRYSALLPDARRLQNLPRLLDIIARARKKSNAQRLIEPARMRFVLGDWGRNQDWRAAMRKQLEPLVPGKQSQTIFSEIKFDDGWLEAMTKNKDAALDPSLIHVAVLWTGGQETAVFPDASQAVSGFWRKRLDQVMSAGILPIVVIGPNFQPADRQGQADEVWQQVPSLAPIRLYSMPVIDLRALPTAADGTWEPGTEQLARELVVDGISETIFTLRRLGAIR